MSNVAIPLQLNNEFSVPWVEFAIAMPVARPRCLAQLWTVCLALVVPMVAADDLPLPAGAVVRLGDAGETDRLRGVDGITVSGDGRHVATRSSDQIVRLWEATTGKLLRELDGYPDSRVSDFIFSTGGEKLLTVSSDAGQPLIAWNVASGEELQRWTVQGKLLRRSKAPGHYLAADSDRAVTFSVTGNREPLHWQLHHKQHQAQPLDYWPDKALLLLSSPAPVNVIGHKLLLFQIEPATTTFFPTFESPITRAVFHPHSGEIAVVCRKDARVHFRSLVDRQQCDTLIGNDESVQDVRYSPDGRFLFTVGTDGLLRGWEMLTRKPVFVAGDHGERWVSMAVSSNGRFVVTGSSGASENGALIWDVNELLFQKVTLSGGAATCEFAWDRLGEVDPERAYPAMAALLQMQNTALTMFAERIAEEVDLLAVSEVDKLITRLQHPSYRVRETATEQLSRMHTAVRGRLEAALQDATQIETRIRLKKILSLDRGESFMASDNVRRWRRMIHVLEWMGHEAAAEQLEWIASGHAHAPIAKDAKDSLSRVRSLRRRL